MNIFRGLTTSKIKQREWERLLDKAELLSHNTFHTTAVNQPCCISQPRLMMPPNPIEFFLLRAVLTSPGPIYFSPFQCTFKFHVNSISLLLGRKQLWLIPSSSWRCPLSQWAKRHMCVWGDWKRGGGVLWVLHTQRTQCPHTYSPATYRKYVDKRCGMVCTKLSGNKIQILPLPPHTFRYVLIQPSSCQHGDWWVVIF